MVNHLVFDSATLTRRYDSFPSPFDHFEVGLIRERYKQIALQAR